MSDENIERRRLTIRQRAVKGESARFQKFIQEYDESKYYELKIRLEHYVNTLDKFNDIQDKIVELSLSEKDECDKERKSFADEYHRNIAEATDLLSKQNPRAVRQGPTSVVRPSTTLEATSSGTSKDITCRNVSAVTTGNAQLPIVVNLPIFDGNIEHWFMFKDNFKALVDDNKSLSKIQKFMYLKLAVKGPAAEVIKSLTVSERNYQFALYLLREKFERKQFVVDSHVKHLIDEEPLAEESATNLRHLLDYFAEHLRALQAVGMPVEEWDIPLTIMLSNKLDDRTQKLWKESGLVTYSQLIKFIENRCVLLESFGSPSKKELKKIKFPARQRSCLLCKKNHSIYKCEKFLAGDSDERFNTIKKLEVCTNCLGGKHTFKNCKSQQKCFICGKLHHTLLHQTSISF